LLIPTNSTQNTTRRVAQWLASWPALSCYILSVVLLHALVYLYFSARLDHTDPEQHHAGQLVASQSHGVVTADRNTSSGLHYNSTAEKLAAMADLYSYMLMLPLLLLGFVLYIQRVTQRPLCELLGMLLKRQTIRTPATTTLRSAAYTVPATSAAPDCEAQHSVVDGRSSEHRSADEFMENIRTSVDLRPSECWSLGCDATGAPVTAGEAWPQHASHHAHRPHQRYYGERLSYCLGTRESGSATSSHLGFAGDTHPASRGADLHSVGGSSRSSSSALADAARAGGGPVLHLGESKHPRRARMCDLPRSELVVVTGRGSFGKTALFRLLSRMSAPVSGRVCFRLHAGGLVASVEQSTPLFDTSVFENIRLGNPAASRRTIRAAAQAAGVHASRLTIPCGVGGQLLSAAEAQRVALGRAFVRISTAPSPSASLLVLDDPFSCQDAASADAILQHLQKLVTSGTTVVALTQHAALCQHADTIIVLEHGRVCERGTHNELLAQTLGGSGGGGSIYARHFAITSRFERCHEGTAVLKVRGPGLRNYWLWGDGGDDRAHAEHPGDRRGAQMHAERLHPSARPSHDARKGADAPAAEAGTAFSSPSVDSAEREIAAGLFQPRRYRSGGAVYEAAPLQSAHGGAGHASSSSGGVDHLTADLSCRSTVYIVTRGQVQLRGGDAAEAAEGGSGDVHATFGQGAMFSPLLALLPHERTAAVICCAHPHRQSGSEGSVTVAAAAAHMLPHYHAGQDPMDAAGSMDVELVVLDGAVLEALAMRNPALNRRLQLCAELQKTLDSLYEFRTLWHGFSFFTDDTQLAAVRTLWTSELWPVGHRIYRRGDECGPSAAPRLYLVIHGAVQVFSGAAMADGDDDDGGGGGDSDDVRRVGALVGEMEMWLCDSLYRQSSAQVTEPCVLLSLSRSGLWQMANASPRFLAFFDCHVQVQALRHPLSHQPTHVPPVPSLGGGGGGGSGGGGGPTWQQCLGRLVQNLGAAPANRPRDRSHHVGASRTMHPPSLQQQQQQQQHQAAQAGATGTGHPIGVQHVTGAARSQRWRRRSSLGMLSIGSADTGGAPFLPFTMVGPNEDNDDGASRDWCPKATSFRELPPHVPF
jgi:ABC-type multidrug transport system fused ATPase/permease subunit/CRP-like cAMP-binding protein